MITEILSLSEYKEPNISQEYSGKGYISFNFEDGDNAFMEEMILRYNEYSSINSNFINLKSRLTYGNGITPVDPSNSVLTEFIGKPNMNQDDVNDILRKVSLDFSILEQAAIQVMYTADGKIGQLLHADVSKLRAKEPEKEGGNIESYYYAKDWGKVKNLGDRRFKEEQAVEIPVFNYSKGKEDKRQVLIIKKYSTGTDTYPIPSYSSGLAYIDLDYLLSRFHLNSVNGGFFPSFSATFIGKPTDADKKKFIREFNNKFTGVEQIKGLFTWVDSMDNAPKFESIETNISSELFDTLQNTVYQQVATAHGGSKELAGFDSGGADLGGDANKLNISRLSFINRVIEDNQLTIIKSFNKIFTKMDLGKVNIINEPLKITQPTSIDTDLTEDERRQWLYGLGPKPTVTDEEDIDKNKI